MSQSFSARPHDDAKIEDLTQACVWYAQVIINEPVGLLDYLIPEKIRAEVLVGTAVRVPLGKRRTSAYVTGITHGPAPKDFALRALLGVDQERPRLLPAVLDLVLFASRYYQCTPGDMLHAALPAMARGATVRFCVTDKGRICAQDAKVEALTDGMRRTLEQVALHPQGCTVAAVERPLNMSRASATRFIQKLCALELVERLHKRPSKGRKIWLYARCPDTALEAFPKRQMLARKFLEQMPVGQFESMPYWLARDPKAPARLRRLEDLGFVEKQALDRPLILEALAMTEQDYLKQGAVTQKSITLTAQQQEALAFLQQSLEKRTYEPFLLHGITGSGKTEIYLRCIEKALEADRGALVLVPEIALTPQLGARFSQRFGDRVATFHSGLSVAQRRNEWERIARGDARIGLGARSALFLPVENLGVIIVDEEHESSFKQEESPRYNARDLALWRGKNESATVILGSATPSLESYYNAQHKRYRYLHLDKRATSQALPTVELIDLAHTKRIEDTALTEPLAKALEQTFLRDEQAILFLNRRGFAPYVFCHDCGHTFRCDACDVTLTLHHKRQILLCHYCNFSIPAPDICPACQSDKVSGSGLGTERLEQDIYKLFGPTPIVRLDRDIIKTKHDLTQALQKFRNQEAKLLIGTQMVAKGHDFPNVTLVGVVSADTSLNFPDFRAAEHTFQLLTQVAGRAGRGSKPGRVLIQAYETEHYAIQTAQTHHYKMFVEHELQARQELCYPPFTYLAQLRFESDIEGRAIDVAEQQIAIWRQALQDALIDVTILGPASAPLARLRGTWRVHVLIKAEKRATLRAALALLPPRSGPQIRRIIDIDPVNML